MNPWKINLSENEHLTPSPDPEKLAKIKFLPKPNAYFTSAYSALATLEKEKQDLAVATKVTSNSYFILTPKTNTLQDFSTPPNSSPTTSQLIYN